MVAWQAFKFYFWFIALILTNAFLFSRLAGFPPHVVVSSLHTLSLEHGDAAWSQEDDSVVHSSALVMHCA